jgi:hypothetical protein
MISLINLQSKQKRIESKSKGRVMVATAKGADQRMRKVDERGVHAG